MAATKTKLLVPGVTEGTKTARAAIAATPPCEASCCTTLVACNPTEQASCAASCSGTWDMPWFDIVAARMEWLYLPDRATALTAPFNLADRLHIILFSMFNSLIPEMVARETILQFRIANTADNLIWNSLAANSADFLALSFGRTHDPVQPTLRSGQVTSDARILTAVHAMAAALPWLLPSAQANFEASSAYALIMPTIGFTSSLTTACGAVENPATMFSSSCLVTWYNSQSPGPSALGQTIAYEVMYYRIRDGWNSLGTDGGCTAGSHFCLPYADRTGYDPESGACLQESLM